MNNLQELLKHHFGFDSFRPGQEQSIQALLEHKRLLCIQPTGYGKSLLYQLPALLFDGLTLVISPLLALMRDQLDHLNSRFEIPAASINSDQSEDENAQARSHALSGKIKILFISPEQLDNLNTVDFLNALPVSLVVVDEAHCISTWGHDFRPGYRRIIKAVHSFQKRQPDFHVLGLTATADHRTEADIAQQLQLPEGPPLQVMRATMDRPNLALGVYPVSGMADKLEVMRHILAKEEGSGIIYCATRENTEIVAEYLSNHGLDVVAYHAGYTSERKRALQSDFLSDKHRAIAATNALGMGIDKPDIRFIVHVDVPGSITAYYQEVGRAGRDGLPARGFLLYDADDRRIQEHFIRSAQPSPEDFQKVLGAIHSDESGDWPSMMMIKIRCGLHPTMVTVILAELAEQNFIHKVRGRGGKQVYEPLGLDKGFPDLSRYQKQREVRDAELESMLRYGETRVDCHMAALRQALGDTEPESCGRCKLCLPDQWTEIERDSSESGHFLAQRSVLIPESKRPVMSEGVSLLNGDLRSPAFIRFMKGRTKADELSPEVIELLRQNILQLAQHHRFGLIVSAPSQTWLQQRFTAQLISQTLEGVPAMDVINWRQNPTSRQGQLLNNDQRKHNVSEKMYVTGRLALPAGRAILLLDDYIGSGATLKEAVRALRKNGGFSGTIVPFTIARIKWKLGAPGMI